MKALWAILCENALVDKYTNNVSLINVIEDINLAAEPPKSTTDRPIAVPVSAKLVCMWVRSNADVGEVGYGQVRLLAPDSKTATQLAQYDVNLGERLRLRHITTVVGLPFFGQGTYRLVVDKKQEDEDWSEASDFEFRILVPNKQV